MSYSLNYTKILLSALTIAFVSALVFGGTQAFFNDEETSEGNLFTAGALDLLVDSQAHYAGLECVGGLWVVEDEEAGTTRPDLEDTACDGTWLATDLGPTNKFFNLGDLKPGDEGENTISLHVENNDAYACVIIDNMQDDDNGTTEPEEEAGDVTPGDGDGLGGGELSSELRFFAWADMSAADEVGNNIWEAGEPVLFSNTEGPASDVIDGVVYPLFTPGLNGGAVLPGAQTQYIGLYWCYGTITVDELTNTLTCDGEGGTNLTQTDSLSADFTFYIEQARNNEGFTCPALEEPAPTTGTITVLKNLVTAGDDGDGDPVPVEADFAPYLIDAVEVTLGDAEVLSPGSYTVSETVIDPDYDVTFSGDCDAVTGAITLAAGENLTCTINNTFDGDDDDDLAQAV